MSKGALDNMFAGMFGDIAKRPAKPPMGRELAGAHTVVLDRGRDQEPQPHDEPFMGWRKLRQIEPVGQFNRLIALSTAFRPQPVNINGVIILSAVASPNQFPDPLGGGSGIERIPDPTSIAAFSPTGQPIVLVVAEIPPGTLADISSMGLFNDSDFFWEIATRDPFNAFNEFTLAFAQAGDFNVAQGVGYYAYNHHQTSRYGQTLRMQACNPTEIGSKWPNLPTLIGIAGTYRPTAAQTEPFYFGSLRLRRGFDRPAYRSGETKTIAVPVAGPSSVCLLNEGAPTYEPLSGYCRNVTVQNTGSNNLRAGVLGRVSPTEGHLLAPGQFIQFETFRIDQIGVANAIPPIPAIDGECTFTAFM